MYWLFMVDWFADEKKARKSEHDSFMSQDVCGLGGRCCKCQCIRFSKVRILALPSSAGEFDTNREKTLVPKQSIDRGNLPSDKARMR